jgi:hypothetical protein
MTRVKCSTLVPKLVDPVVPECAIRESYRLARCSLNTSLVNFLPLNPTTSL